MEHVASNTQNMAMLSDNCFCCKKCSAEMDQEMIEDDLDDLLEGEFNESEEDCDDLLQLEEDAKEETLGVQKKSPDLRKGEPNKNVKTGYQGQFEEQKAIALKRRAEIDAKFNEFQERLSNMKEVYRNGFGNKPANKQ